MRIEPVTADEVGGEMGRFMREYAIEFLTTLQDKPVVWHKHLVARLKRHGENPIRIYLGLEPARFPAGPWKLGVIKKRKATDEEIALALTMTNTMREAADLLDINITTLYQRLNPDVLVRYRRNSGSPPRDSGEVKCHDWLPHEDELVWEHKMTDRLLSVILGVSLMAVRSRRSALKERGYAERVGA